MTLLEDSSAWKSRRQHLKPKQLCKKWAGFNHPAIYGDTTKRTEPWERSCHSKDTHFLSGDGQVLLFFYWGYKE